MLINQIGNAIPGGPSGGRPFARSRRYRHAYPAEPGWIALLWLFAAGARIFTALVFPGEVLPSPGSALFQASAPVLAAFLAAHALRLRGATLHLVSAMLSLEVLAAFVTLAIDLVSSDAIVASLTGRAVFVFAAASLLGWGFTGLRSGARRVVAILLMIALPCGADYLTRLDSAFWDLSTKVRVQLGKAMPAESEDPAPPTVAADVLWGAQPHLVERQLASLHPHLPGATNVYAMAIAGSGMQALFSREAHEALRVAARHFGENSRGGILLSNGADDRMLAPLATRDTIAAVARGIGAKADRQHDLLFVYLASHGSRSAELASDLPDAQQVQPISAASTADALRRAGIRQRVVIVSACFAATWIPALADDDTIILTAAAKDRVSFGCDDSRRLTLFGESMLGSLARPGISLHDAFDDARRKIAAKEARQKITPSFPQVQVGRHMQALWLGR